MRVLVGIALVGLATVAHAADPPPPPGYSRDFNQRLRQRLGIPDWSSVALVPAAIRTDRAISWGPSLSFRF